MKVSRYSLEIFVSEIEALDKLDEEVKTACKDWIYAKDNNKDQYEVNLARNKVERVLIEFRQKISTIYDFMGDRGLVNFIPPTQGANNDYRKPECEDSVRVCQISDESSSIDGASRVLDFRH